MSNKDKICALLKSIETGETSAVAIVNEAEYRQHNPQTEEGSEGLAELFQRLSQTSPRVNIVRAFEDGDFVFAHTEYDFANRNIGFEVFRFEVGQAVEHWDNIQPRQGPNPAGNSMVNGPTEASDLTSTEFNRARVVDFVDKVLIAANVEAIEEFIDPSDYTEHNPRLDNDVSKLKALLIRGAPHIHYQRRHRVLAEGNFVLSVCEGEFDSRHCAFYDLFRLADGMLVEHWDTTEAIAPQAQWKNNNGKF